MKAYYPSFALSLLLYLLCYHPFLLAMEIGRTVYDEYGRQAIIESFDDNNDTHAKIKLLDCGETIHIAKNTLGITSGEMYDFKINDIIDNSFKIISFYPGRKVLTQSVKNNLFFYFHMINDQGKLITPVSILNETSLCYVRNKGVVKYNFKRYSGATTAILTTRLPFYGIENLTVPIRDICLNDISMHGLILGEIVFNTQGEERIIEGFFMNGDVLTIKKDSRYSQEKKEVEIIPKELIGIKKTSAKVINANSQVITNDFSFGKVICFYNNKQAFVQLFNRVGRIYDLDKIDGHKKPVQFFTVGMNVLHDDGGKGKIVLFYYNLMALVQFSEKELKVVPLKSLQPKKSMISNLFGKKAPQYDISFELEHDYLLAPKMNKEKKDEIEDLDEIKTSDLKQLAYNKDYFTCVICCDEEAKTVLEPCLHLVTCSKCAQKLHHCPSCQVKIARKIEIRR